MSKGFFRFAPESGPIADSLGRSALCLPIGDIRARTNHTLGGCDEYISKFLWPVDHHVVAAGHADELPAPIIL